MWPFKRNNVTEKPKVLHEVFPEIIYWSKGDDIYIGMSNFIYECATENTIIVSQKGNLYEYKFGSHTWINQTLKQQKLKNKLTNSYNDFLKICAEQNRLTWEKMNLES